MIYIWLFLAGLFGQATWDLNDVSYLLPLPQASSSVDLLQVDSAGKKGTLLTEAYINEGPPLLMDREEVATQQALRVVGVRLDPCFTKEVPAPCQAQVRLVWQPLQTRNGQVESIDAALHSFYNLSEAEFRNLLKDLQQWKAKYPVRTQGLPLQVHPAFKNPEAVSVFQKIILQYAGVQNISRLTMMVLRGNSMMWGFMGFDIEGGEIQPIQIARVGRTGQSFVNLSQTDFQRGGMAPVLKTTVDTVVNLVAESKRLAVGQGKDDLVREETLAALRIEHPGRYTSENMDCVSCHVAQPALNWVRQSRADLNIFAQAGGDLYQNPRYNLENISLTKNHTQNIRSFGYFAKSMALNQRVINESAEVADVINSWLR